MTKEYLINILESSNWIKTKDYEDEGIVYQKTTIDDDFIEITVYPVRYEIEYFSKVGPNTYNSYLLCNKFFAYEYDDEKTVVVEKESLSSNED